MPEPTVKVRMKEDVQVHRPRAVFLLVIALGGRVVTKKEITR